MYVLILAHHRPLNQSIFLNIEQLTQINDLDSVFIMISQASDKPLVRSVTCSFGMRVTKTNDRRHVLHNGRVVLSAATLVMRLD